MQKLDRLRGLYVRSPGWVKRISSPALALVPIPLRYGSTYRLFRQDIRRSESEAGFVAQYQIRQLRSIYQSCIDHSLYYRELFRKVYGSIPSVEDYSFADLQQLPLLEKDTIRENPESFLVKDRSEMDVVSTSGSSGKPLRFYLDKNRSVKEWAFINHIWSRIGYQPGQRRAVLRGVLINNVDANPWEFDPAMNELRLSPFHLTPEIMDSYLGLIQRYKITYLHGYPSAIYILARHAQNVGWGCGANLRGVLTISETLFSFQREFLSQVFPNARILPFYGMSEKVAIAGEVPGEPDLYEFEPLYGFGELVNDQGQPVTETGQPGRIVATGFLCTGMPLLRYDTGDEAVLVRLPRPDNFYRLRVRNIRSRWAQEFLVSKQGALISMAAINIHSPVYSFIQEFQFYQDTPGLALVRIVPMPGKTSADFIPFVEEIMEKTGTGIDLQVRLVDQLAQNSRGKRPFIDQQIDHPLVQQNSG
jgi:phenylacetate-CoA ligase